MRTALLETSCSSPEKIAEIYNFFIKCAINLQIQEDNYRHTYRSCQCRLCKVEMKHIVENKHKIPVCLNTLSHDCFQKSSGDQSIDPREFWIVATRNMNIHTYRPINITYFVAVPRCCVAACSNLHLDPGRQIIIDRMFFNSTQLTSKLMGFSQPKYA
jgi:hypothetical protein